MFWDVNHQKPSAHGSFSMAMLNYRRVNYLIKLLSPREIGSLIRQKWDKQYLCIYLEGDERAWQDCPRSAWHSESIDVGTATSKHGTDIWPMYRREKCSKRCFFLGGQSHCGCFSLKMWYQRIIVQTHPRRIYSSAATIGVSDPWINGQITKRCAQAGTTKRVAARLF